MSKLYVIQAAPPRVIGGDSGPSGGNGRQIEELLERNGGLEIDTQSSEGKVVHVTILERHLFILCLLDWETWGVEEGHSFVNVF